MKFNFDWLFSSERKKLQKELIQQKLDNAKKQLDNYDKQSFILDNEIAVIKKEAIKPYKKLTKIDQSITVILHNGDMLSSSIGGKDLFNKIIASNSEDEVKALFLYSHTEDKDTSMETKEERKTVREEWQILIEHEDFEYNNDELYLKGTKFSLPAPIIAAFIEIVEKINGVSIGYNYTEKLDINHLKEQYTSLKLFTLKLALNPIQSSRADAMRFVKEHNIRLTSLGNLVMFRSILSVKDTVNKSLSNYISTEYFRIKTSWKKSPSNYYIWEEDDGTYTTYKGIAKNKSDGIGKFIGYLDDLYVNLNNMEENRYTDNHTKTMDIRIGSVYSISENEVDIDSREDCSAGLEYVASL